MNTRRATVTAYPWGDNPRSDSSAMANCNSCGSDWDKKQSAPVGSFPPNKFGLYDMVGNVFEWTEDCSHGGYVGAPTDGSAWVTGGVCSSRIARGGSFAMPPAAVRSALRIGFAAVYRSVNSGFRVARTLAIP